MNLLQLIQSGMGGFAIFVELGFVSLLSLSAFSLIVSDTSFGELPDLTAAEIYWEKANFPHHEGTKAVVIVTDPDMNRHPNVIDHIWVTVYSDTDSAGFRMPIFETGFNSSIFEGKVTFVETPPSERGFLYTVVGDTITAKYVDKTFPTNYVVPDSKSTVLTEGGLEMHSTAIVGRSLPPLGVALVSNLRLLSLGNEPITDNSIPADQQIRLVSDLENRMDHIQPFAYLVQIQNEQNQVESLSWITGNLTTFQKISPGVAWVPPQEGLYTVTVFVWQSINDPTVLSPPLSMELSVG